MKQSKRRILPFLLAVCTLLGCLLPGVTPAKAAASDYPNTYVNTGNQRKDIIGVALTQLGYAEGANNDSKYGTETTLTAQEQDGEYILTTPEVAPWGVATVFCD